MFALQILSKLVKVLRSAASPRQIAWGFALGTIWGFTPLFSLHNLVVLVLVMVLILFLLVVLTLVKLISGL